LLLADLTKKALRFKPVRRLVAFTKGYATQLAFAFIVGVFLTITVGEGQAYQIDTPKVAAQIQDQNDAFLGKPQLFAGQTLLTGEVQELLAISYTVEKGDTLISIANRYNISVGTIIDANNIPIDQIEKIKPGTELLIPSEDTNTSLAWLDGINKIKEEERERLRQEELKRQAARRAAQTPRIGPAVRLAEAIGGYTIIGTFRNLPTYGAFPGQCTNWVKYKRPDLPPKMGNGGQYLAYARSYGIPTGSIPRVGAVVVTSEAAVGHVAYVERVNGDTITISEMNYVRPFVVSQRTISIHSSVIRGYIY
jgi:LysM repeat protein